MFSWKRKESKKYQENDGKEIKKENKRKKERVQEKEWTR